MTSSIEFLIQAKDDDSAAVSVTDVVTEYHRQQQLEDIRSHCYR